MFKKMIRSFLIIVLLTFTIGAFLGCSNSSHKKDAENFIKTAYSPEETDVFDESNFQVLGEGVPEDKNSENKLEKYLQDKFKPLMTQDGYNRFSGQNPLIWLGIAKNQDGMEIKMSNIELTKVNPEKSSDEFEYYDYKFNLEYLKDGKKLDEQAITGQLRLTEDGLVDDVKQGVLIEVPSY